VGRRGLRACSAVILSDIVSPSFRVSYRERSDATTA
jgi:hypothetical protein